MGLTPGKPGNTSTARSEGFAIGTARESFRIQKWLLPVAIILLVVIATFAFRLQSQLDSLTVNEENDRAIVRHLNQLLTALDDAETGQRGFLLTGKDEYLVPFNLGTQQAVLELVALLEVTRGQPEQYARVQAVESLTKQKFTELRLTVTLFRTKGLQAALVVVSSDRGKKLMDLARIICARIRSSAYAQVMFNSSAIKQYSRYSFLVTCGVLLMLLLLSALFFSRSADKLRKRYNHDLREQALLLDLANDSIVIRNREDQITYWNWGAERLYGWKKKEVQGRASHDVLKTRFPQPIAEIEAQLLAEGHWEGELIHIRRDGSPVIIASNWTIQRDKSNRLESVLELNQDITDRKTADEKRARAEARFRGLLEDAPDAIVVANRNGEITLVNAQVGRLFGYAREELIGQQIEMLLPNCFPWEHPGQQGGHLSESRKQFRGAAAELIAIRKDGTEFPVEVSQSPLETEEGTLISSAIRDVTQRKKVELEIVALNKQLGLAATAAQDANRAKSVFLSTISHEIRTPLNAILGYAQLMLRDPALGNDAKTKLTIINRSGEHLLGLINDVLDMSKIEAGRAELHSVVFSLEGLFDDLTNMFQLRAELKALTFELLITGPTGYYVAGDESKIRQVLINLIGNAIKFTSHGGIKLHVVLNETAGTSDLRLYVRVDDTGSGLSDEELQTLFEPFRQAKGGLNTGGGTGLGLAISRDFARLMGGDITVTSQPGFGSSFRFEVPLERSEGFATSKGMSPGRVIGIHAGLKTPTILVVDDQFENRDSLMRLLTCVGFSVQGAENGALAIRSWEENKPQLILMDVHMPVMNGLEATRRIKADPRGAETIIVALTASALDEDRRTITASGADLFLAKPCPENQLFEALRKLLNITFDYEAVSHLAFDANDAPVTITAADLSAIPIALRGDLRTAVINGDKREVNKLILRVRESSTNHSAAALQQLADRYEYDTLTQLLHESGVA